MASIAYSIDDRSTFPALTLAPAGGKAEAMQKVMAHLLHANAACLRMPGEALAHIRSAGALVAAFLDHPEPAPPARGGLTTWQARRLEAHIADNIENRITIDALASLAGLSVGHFCRAFKASFGCSPQAYLIDRRVREAQKMMLAGEDRLAQISAACGFSDQSHFSHVFRRSVGHSPADWRRRHRQPASL